jgi:ParB/RepB/Spo0J family partition protein
MTMSNPPNTQPRPDSAPLNDRKETVVAPVAKLACPLNGADFSTDHPPGANGDMTVPTYVLVHEHPSWLLPVKKDKRDRTGPDYGEYFARFTADVRERGVLQPIIAFRKGETAETVDGETRRLAALMAGVDSVPILVYGQPLSDADLVLAQLQSNEMRLGFSELERAELYATLMQLNGWTQAELARFIHVSPSRVSRVMSISQRLPEELRLLIGEGDGKIPPSSAYHLSRLPTPEVMKDMAEKIVKGLLCRDAVGSAVTEYLRKGKGTKKDKPVKVTIEGVTVIIATQELQKIFSLLASLDAALKKLEKHGLPLSALPSLLRT